MAWPTKNVSREYRQGNSDQNEWQDAECPIVVKAKDIEERYPFKNIPGDWEGLYAPDNGVINMQLLLRTLLSLAKDYGAKAKQHTRVGSINLSQDDNSTWEIHTTHHDMETIVFKAKKIIITSGAYVNHILKPSFSISLDLDIWEMVFNYFNANAGPQDTIFPSTSPATHSCVEQCLTLAGIGMWFQFAPDKNRRSQLFYGFPTLPWGPPNVARIAVDAATSRIIDPSERRTNVVNPEGIRDTQDFIQAHLVGVDPTVPAFTSTCLQTNVFGVYFLVM